MTPKIVFNETSALREELDSFEERLIARLDDRFVMRCDCEDNRARLTNKIFTIGGIMGTIGTALGIIIRPLLPILILSSVCFPLDYDIGGTKKDDSYFYHADIKAKQMYKAPGFFNPVDFLLNVEGSEYTSAYTFTIRSYEYAGPYKSKTRIIHEYNSALNISRTSLRKSFEHDMKSADDRLILTPELEVFIQGEKLLSEVAFTLQWLPEIADFKLSYRINNDESHRKFTIDSGSFGVSFEDRQIQDEHYNTSKVYIKGEL